MDVQVITGSLIRAIADCEISTRLEELIEPFRQGVLLLIKDFAETPTAQRTTEFENGLYDRFRELGRQLIEWLFSQLEPEVEDMPGAVKYRGNCHRRLYKKTVRKNILTRFGKVSLRRAGYRRGRAGRTIFPLEIILGIERGFTSAVASRIGQQFAICGSSQGRTIEMIHDQTGAKIGPEKLRKLVAALTGGLEPLRQEAQVEKLLALIEEARRSGDKPVLSVSRDGVALGMAPWSYFEMASVACVSVLASGNKLGTVYLGCVPESNQVTLSNQLSGLLRETIHRCGDIVPDIVYVSDAGKVESAYWRSTLSKFYVDGRRIKIARIVDYYHAAERLTTIADALKLGKEDTKRKEWLEHARWLLLQPGGHGRVLRSIAEMRRLYGYKAGAKNDANKAEQYLRKYGRFMDYAAMKSRGYPIGSGVVESACKQIVSERMKLSGMRWTKEGGQQIMTLRCILLSGIWDRVFKNWLAKKPTVSDLINLRTA